MQVRAARATATTTATWVAGDKEGDGNDGKGERWRQGQWQRQQCG